MVGAGERLVEDAKMAAQGARAVDVERSAETRGEIGDCDLFGEKPIILVVEVIHV